MGIRRNDMRVVVFGLLYLMRSGITIHEICVLPAISALHDMLPNESNLLKHHRFRSKFITDTEVTHAPCAACRAPRRLCVHAETGSAACTDTCHVFCTVGRYRATEKNKFKYHLRHIPKGRLTVTGFHRGR